MSVDLFREFTSDDEGRVRTQFAALCYRVKKKSPQVLLITSRNTRRWIIPKGWPMEGKTPVEAAKIEALEEAGVEGRISGPCVGIYTYRKFITEKKWMPVAVAVFPIKVTDLRVRFKEADERRRKWFSPKKAAAKVGEPELKEILRHFDPKARR